MTVKELIEKLKELDGDREIYFQDSEYWYSLPIKEIEENCIFRYKIGRDWDNFKRWEIFDWEWYDKYEREKKGSDGIVEYKDTYIIK